MHTQTQIWSMYRITNKINGKIYIGQAADLSKRWSDHRRAVKLNKPTQVIHHALIKYGLENFEFEVIASCKTQENANEIETELVEQYDSFIKNNKGYNATLGGMNAPKTEVFKKMMRDWHASLSSDERAEISQKQSEATLKQIEIQGHPAQGRIVTEEEKELHRKTRLDNPLEYTPELRQRMSEAHIGLTDSEETKQKKSISIKKSWENRISYDEIRCEASGCEVSGKAKYIILDDIRYCTIHGQRLRRTGFLELQPRSSHNKGKKTSEETLQKLRGRTPYNKITFNEDQLNIIMSSTLSNKKIAKEMGVTEKVIKRIKSENKAA